MSKDHVYYLIKNEFYTQTSSISSQVNMKWKACDTGAAESVAVESLLTGAAIRSRRVHALGVRVTVVFLRQALVHICSDVETASNHIQDSNVNLTVVSTRHSPMHLIPSPSQPSRQRHLKLPGMLTQEACMSQLWALISHSSISDAKQTL